MRISEPLPERLNKTREIGSCVRSLAFHIGGDLIA
jgi:hypothetical protein